MKKLIEHNEIIKYLDTVYDDSESGVLSKKYIMIIVSFINKAYEKGYQEGRKSGDVLDG